MSRYERTFHRRLSAFETVTGKQDLFRRQDQPIRSGAVVWPAVICSSGDAYKPGWPQGHASLALQQAPEATPPASQVWRSYYHAAGRRIAMRVQDGVTGANQVHYLFADHLGSTHVTHNTANSSSTAQCYYPWGSVRPGPNNALPTGYTQCAASRSP